MNRLLLICQLYQRYHSGLKAFSMGMLLLLAFTHPALAGDPTYVRWNALHLDPSQETQLSRLDEQWKKIYTERSPQLQRDRAELRRLMFSPQANDKEIMALRERIHKSEELLRVEAMKSFIQKKNVLTPGQRMQLQQLFSPGSASQ
jgi:Spy/CpxP family protein refolding chaperone